MNLSTFYEVLLEYDELDFLLFFRIEEYNAMTVDLFDHEVQDRAAFGNLLAGRGLFRVAGGNQQHSYFPSS